MNMKFPTYLNTTMWEIRAELQGHHSGSTVIAHPEPELIRRYVVLHVAAPEAQSAVEVGGDVENFYPGNVHVDEKSSIIVKEAKVVSIAPMFSIDHATQPAPKPEDVQEQKTHATLAKFT